MSEIVGTKPRVGESIQLMPDNLGGRRSAATILATCESRAKLGRSSPASWIDADLVLCRIGRDELALAIFVDDVSDRAGLAGGWVRLNRRGASVMAIELVGKETLSGLDAIRVAKMCQTAGVDLTIA